MTLLVVGGVCVWGDGDGACCLSYDNISYDMMRRYHRIWCDRGAKFLGGVVQGASLSATAVRDRRHPPELFEA